MPPAPTFSAQALGQTEKALNAILTRQLDGTDLTEIQWVTLNIVAAAGGELPWEALAARVADGLKVEDAEARARISELAVAGLVRAPGAVGSPVAVTEAGDETL